MRIATGTAARGLADWLSLAAAPTFALMALLAIGGGDADICSSIQSVPLLNGMASMYLLMSVFHVAPWLKLISAKREAPSRRAPPRISPPT
ncbi:hypothetical protein C7U60_04000 [Mesorhizobium plurifarium]|uniref:hypothetical protein n=1 Tax=Sinorhizobium arboris TaxID=76745 RepID=UPI000416121C|nr:hypothetical protein [Sinorhizobium arboris]PST26509.1 hypothetical protein C7U60_04000 [Mesorhizobium plurifarium]